MRLSCFLTLSLLGVIFSTFKDGECSLVRLSNRQNEEVNLHYLSHKEHELENVSPGKDLGNDVEGRPESLDNATELDGAVAQDRKTPVVLNMDTIEFGKCPDNAEVKLMDDVTAEPSNGLLGKFGFAGESHEKSQRVPNEQIQPKYLRTDITEASEKVECPTVFFNRMVAQRQVVEGVWILCLDKMSAYSQNRHFFKKTLPTIMSEIKSFGNFKVSVAYTAENFSMNMKTFCEEKSLDAFLENLMEIWHFADKYNVFDSLSDEFVALTADYMRSTIAIRKLYLMLEDSQAFTGPRFQIADDSIYTSSLLNLLVSLKKLVKEIKESDLMGIYRRFASALDVNIKTMGPANKDLLFFFTDLLVWEIFSLADKASGSISTACDRVGLSKTAQEIIGDVENITLLLQHENLDTSSGTAEQRGVIEIGWNRFLESLFALEQASVKANIKIIAKTSEGLSELIDTLLDTFLRGEDEAWTCALSRKLIKAYSLWDHALKTLNSATGIATSLTGFKYLRWIAADFYVILHMTTLIESLEDSLALDRLTREKLVEYWREAQALSRLSAVLLVLEAKANRIAEFARVKTDAVVKKLLVEILSGEINILKRQGINFQQGRYHRFINDLPDHQQQMAQSCREFSDSISRSFAEASLVEKVNKLFSSLKSRSYNHLKQSLITLFTSPRQISPQSHPQLPQPQIPPSRGSRQKNKKAKKKGNKLKQTPESHRPVADPKASTSDTRQVFVHSGTQYVNLKEASTSAEGGLDEHEESSGKPWYLVTKSRDVHTLGRLIKQPAREILIRFRGKPRGWDGALPTNPQDMRSDKQKVKIAAFNVEWLFLFNLATDKLCDKVKWKFLREAWDHIKDVADAIREIDADILCLYEVQDLRILSILIGLLPELNYRAYLIPNHDSFGQNVGILTRVDKLVSVSRVEEAFFPKNIVLHLKLDNGCGDSVDLVLSSVHLISSTADTDPIERARLRKSQVTALKEHLMDTYGPSKEIIHLVAGDFNVIDPELLPRHSSQLSEEALDILKHENPKLFNVMDPTNTHSDLLSSSVCHIFTSHPHLVAESQIIKLSSNNASCRLKRVSDHPPVVATLHLPN